MVDEKVVWVIVVIAILLGISYLSGWFGNEPLFSPFSVNVTVGNAPPQIIFVEPINGGNGVMPNEGDIIPVNFKFTVTDDNGPTDLTGAKAIFQYTGEPNRENSTCVNAGEDTTTSRNFSCTVGMWYFDIGDVNWTINVTATDSATQTAENSTTNFHYNNLVASTNDNAMNWTNIPAAGTNMPSSSNPFNISNTGNAERDINVTAYNLRGTTDPNEVIFAGNFTIDDVTNGCLGNVMANATTRYTGAFLSRGNNSAGEGLQDLYFCITALNPGLSAQTYSSENNWRIEI